MPAYLTIPGLISLVILSQLCPVCVTEDPGALTFFDDAAAHGATGLLAHNYLAGAWFYELSPGELVELQYPDRTEYFVVQQVVEYPGTQDESVKDAIFHEVYTPGRLVLQTCTGAGGWRFVIAVPAPDPKTLNWRLTW